MRKRKKGERHSAASQLELCDLCAAAFPRDEAVRGHVPDSSSAHPTQDWFDGLRLITACSDTHFGVIREAYRRRPFVEEELWAAKIGRALTTGSPVVSLLELACRTGLDEQQIRRAVAWHNRQRRQHKDG
ncbi:hypothetical protein [Streptomyces chiangmaiensis]|uniref:Uncharacterized protein n=1 Tax=Streptomyces chiangmaiensis TaxID=766497 RepID=A0ABU7FDF4_9ACTN|nr:hypothetical protein [Streptomyces chiangmaiensis]MED7821828.1 hypothetical protein [Streptomyces chiangmaiensis]